LIFCLFDNAVPPHTSQFAPGWLATRQPFETKVKLMNYAIERHSLDFPEMDVQHDYLYMLFDRIENASKVTDKTATGKLLLEIEHYLLFHFASEEHLIRMYNVPTFTVHRSDHEQAGERFSIFIDDFEAEKLNPSNLKDFLFGWLTEHARTSDSEYVSWIKKYRSAL
jgi:hemerythrin